MMVGMSRKPAQGATVDEERTDEAIAQNQGSGAEGTRPEVVLGERNSVHAQRQQEGAYRRGGQYELGLIP